MNKNTLDKKVDLIKKEFNGKMPIVIRKFLIGSSIDAAVIFIDVLVDKKKIDENIMKPLMFNVKRDLVTNKKTAEYIRQCFIPVSNSKLEKNFDNIITSIKEGCSVILINKVTDVIIISTPSGNHRSINDPVNESVIIGSREGFVENIETNINILMRKIKDKNLIVEDYNIGTRSQTRLSLVYIDGLVDYDVLNNIRNSINSIQVDSVITPSMLVQYMEKKMYSIFPKSYETERPDIVEANLMEGRIAVILNGAPNIIIAPAVFFDFFQGLEDYYFSSIISSFLRITRIIAFFLSISLPPIYLTFIKYNPQFIPTKFIVPIAQSRIGIPISPMFEIIAMEIFIELLREGGLRLPPKIAQTISVVGGIIIGEAALKSKIVSPTTLLIVGISAVSNFVIPNYNMSVSIRFIKFPMLLLADILGILGVTLSWLFIIIHLASQDSFGVPYFSIKASDIKDIFIRIPLWHLNRRIDTIPNSNKKSQTHFINKSKENRQ